MQEKLKHLKIGMEMGSISRTRPENICKFQDPTRTTFQPGRTRSTRTRFHLWKIAVGNIWKVWTCGVFIPAIPNTCVIFFLFIYLIKVFFPPPMHLTPYLYDLPFLRDTRKYLINLAAGNHLFNFSGNRQLDDKSHVVHDDTFCSLNKCFFELVIGYVSWGSSAEHFLPLLNRLVFQIQSPSFFLMSFYYFSSPEQFSFSDSKSIFFFNFGATASVDISFDWESYWLQRDVAGFFIFDFIFFIILFSPHKFRYFRKFHPKNGKRKKKDKKMLKFKKTGTSRCSQGNFQSNYMFTGAAAPKLKKPIVLPFTMIFEVRLVRFSDQFQKIFFNKKCFIYGLFITCKVSKRSINK